MSRTAKPAHDSDADMAPELILSQVPPIALSTSTRARVHAATATGTIRRLRGEIEALRELEDVQRARIQELEAELRLAASLQRNLRSAMPPIQGATIHSLLRPAAVVSGDMVDVVRLSETEVAVTLLDATGHGLAAGLLATYVKRSLDGKGLTQNDGAPPPPDEVLAGLNQHLLDIQLEACQFVTAVYMVYDEHTRLIRWARAGAPYPVLMQPGERPRELVSGGPLLGVLPDAEFEMAEWQLAPGETLLVHTDGLDTLLARAQRPGNRSHLSPADLFCQHHAGGFAEFWGEFSEFVTSSAQSPELRDDLTVVALHVEQPDAHRTETPAEKRAKSPARVATWA